MNAMNAIRHAVQDFLAVFPAPHRQLPPVVAAGPARLHPIAWGKPDRALGRAVCYEVQRRMPPTVTVQRWVPPRNLKPFLGLCGWCVAGLLVIAAIAIGVRV